MRNKRVLAAAFAILGAAGSPCLAEPLSDNTETVDLTSTVFDNTRSLRVLLPPGYRDPENASVRYPVLYMNDGFMVFNKTYNLEETVHSLIKSGTIEPIIVVGVDNGASTDKTKNEGLDRANEYLPFPDVGFPGATYAGEPPSPQGKRYPDFLTKEVMPLIQSRYRVKTGPANTSLGGSSYGGVAALYTAIARPGLFGRLLIESTPLWIGPDRQLLKEAEKARLWLGAIYIASGTRETDDAAVIREGARDRAQLVKAIQTNSPGTRLLPFIEDGGEHGPASWGRRLPAALKFLFGKRN